MRAPEVYVARVCIQSCCIHASASDAVVVTDNREFRPIDDL